MREKSKMTVKRLATILMAVLVVITSIGLDPQEVSAKNPTNQITFKNGKEIKLYAGEYTSLTVDRVYCGGNCTYDSKTDKAVSKKAFNYSSNKPGIATVSGTGKITAKNKGKATITVTSVYASNVVGKITVKVGKAQKTSITLKTSKATIGVGKKTTIKVSKLKGVSNTDKVKGVTFKSDNEKVATVTSKGVVRGVKAGKTKITVTSKVNKKVKATFTVKVRNNDVLNTKVNSSSKKKSITLEKDSVKLAPQSSFKYWQDLQNNMPKKKLTVAYLLETYESGAMDLDGSVVAAQMMKSNEKKYGKAQIKIKSVTGLKNATVKYKSSKPSVATVSETGEVTPKKAGTAVITVTSKEDKSVTAKYTVNVSRYVTGFDFMMYTNLNNSKLDHCLSVRILPSDADNQNYTVRSSDESIIKVERWSNGKYAVYGMKNGTATLTIKSKDGKCKYSWDCTVSDDETTCWGWRGMGED